LTLRVVLQTHFKLINTVFTGSRAESAKKGRAICEITDSRYLVAEMVLLNVRPLDGATSLLRHLLLGAALATVARYLDLVMFTSPDA